MTGFWATHRRKGIFSLGALLVSAGVGTFSVGAQTSATDVDPLAMFGELMPVFSSPRCVNCHGATNPATDLNHQGGKIEFRDGNNDDLLPENGESLQCLECPPAPAAKAGWWRLASN